MKTIKKLSAIALVAASLVGGAANASVLALADMNIKALGLYGLNGLPIAEGQLTIVGAENRTGNASAKYNGVAKSDTASDTKAGATVNVIGQCVGNCAGAAGLYSSLDNDYTTHLSAPGTVNFALGDMNISGTALGGEVNGLTRANAVSASGTNEGSANATILNSGRIEGAFTVGTTFTGFVGVLADYWVQAYVDSLGGLASAGLGWNIQITSTAPGFTTLNYSPSELNQGFTSGEVSENISDGNANFFGLSAERTYTEGFRYNFTINQSSNAVIQEFAQVPEPGSLAMLGLGLLGLAATRRRRVK